MSKITLSASFLLLFSLPCIFSIQKKKESERRFENKITLSKASRTNKFDYDISKYSWFAFPIENKTYYLADVLDPMVFDSNTFEMRLITNVTETDGIPREFVSNTFSPYLEIITQNEENLEAKYYELDQITTQTIIRQAKSADKYSDVEKRLITSFNFYFSNTAQATNQLNSYSKVRRNTAEANINSQASLDYFLKTKEIEKICFDYSTFAYPGEHKPTHYNIDSAIATLLPKSVFTYEGIKNESGMEWGYYIKTVKEKDDSLLSQVLIYDIAQLKATDNTSDIITIKVVEHSNYKYNKTDDSVFYYGENNLCIGNPTLESAIDYVTLSDDENKISHPNPGDSDYNKTEDDGFAFKGFDICHVGVGKNSDGKTNAANKLFSFGVDLASSFVLSKFSGMPWIATFAIGEVISFAANSVFDQLIPTQKFSDDIKKEKDGTYKYQASEKFSSGINYANARKAGKLTKSTFLRMPPCKKANESQTNKNISNNRQTPLLFKNSNHSINFNHILWASENNDSYTAIIQHHLTLDIFDDDSIWLWKFDPTFLASANSSWGYLIGEDIKPTAKSFSATDSSINIAFGTKSTQNISFTPQNPGNFDIVLTNATPDSTLSIDGLPPLEITKFEDIFQSPFYNEEITRECNRFNCTYKANVRLSVGKTYNIRVMRKANGLQYGSATLSIYEAQSGIGSPQEFLLSNSANGIISHKVKYKGWQQTIHTYSKKDELVTISLTSSSLDTYLTILDDYYRPIVSDDDSFGIRNAGYVIRLKAYSSVYIIPRLYNRVSSGDFSLTVGNCRWMPKFNLEKATSEQKMEIRLNSSISRTYYYYLSFDFDCNFTIYNPYFSEVGYVYIYDASFVEIKNTRMWDDSMLTIEAKSNEVFIIAIEIYSPTSSSYIMELSIAK